MARVISVKALSDCNLKTIEVCSWFELNNDRWTIESSNPKIYRAVTSQGQGDICKVTVRLLFEDC